MPEGLYHSTLSAFHNFHYGNTGYGVESPGMQNPWKNHKDFFSKNNNIKEIIEFGELV